jgi:outer membrane lipoprotein carrier protein
MRSFTLSLAILVLAGGIRQSVAQQPTAKPVVKPPHVERAEPMEMPSTAEILKRAAAAYSKVKSFRAEFVQKRENPLLGSTSTNRGSIYQKRPDRFLMKFTQPAGDVIVSDGRYFWVYYPSADKRQVLRAPASADASSGVDLFAQFVGDPERRFAATFHGIETANGRSAYVLTLVPRGDAQYKSLKVWLDTKDFMARHFILTEYNGVVQEFTLSNLRINPVLNNDLFRFMPPPNARIVEQPV